MTLRRGTGAMLAVFLFCCGLAWAGAPDVSAVVVRLKGTTLARNPKDTPPSRPGVKVSLLTPIYQGYTVSVLEGECTLSFAKHGTRAILSAGANVIVTNEGVTPVTDKVKLVKIDGREARVLPSQVDRNKMGGVSGRALANIVTDRPAPLLEINKDILARLGKTPQTGSTIDVWVREAVPGGSWTDSDPSKRPWGSAKKLTARVLGPDHTLAGAQVLQIQEFVLSPGQDIEVQMFAQPTDSDDDVHFFIKRYKIADEALAPTRTVVEVLKTEPTDLNRMEAVVALESAYLFEQALEVANGLSGEQRVRALESIRSRKRESEKAPSS